MSASVNSVMTELKQKGSEKGRSMYARHGMPADKVLGVSVADLKTIAKRIKGNQTLALDLCDTGIMDAMYLAGMVADGSKMTKAQLEKWAAGASEMQIISEYAVPWVTVENPHAREMALQWIKSKEERVAAAGWCTYSGIVVTTDDSELDLAEIENLLNRVVKEIGGAKNRVRHTMNNFVIAVGTSVKPLSKKALAAATAIGVVTVEMGGTACRVPSAPADIQKAEAAGKLGKKKKTIRC